MLLKAFPGEILFSRLCRSLSVSGLPVQKFSRSLGLEARSSFHPFLTQHLTEIAETSHENAELLWAEQTLFPLWVWSMPGYAKALRQLTGPPARLLWFYQLTGNHSSQRMQLHFCPVCAREDATGYGVPYWHCEHQIPGVSICKRHCCRLMPRLVPPSPHIAVEFYPDKFNNMILSKNIENDFAVFASQILTRLAHGEEISDNYLSGFTSTRTDVKNMKHSGNEKLYMSLNDLIRHLWEENSDPVISDRSHFLYYITSNFENMFPAQKLLLCFYLHRMQSIRQRVSEEHNTPHQINKENINNKVHKDVMELNHLMVRLWPSTKFIVEFRTFS
ncbi:TniQ family protein [Enterobacter cloacae complex sp. ECC445]|uniref:TniQ family protein n=1 Tax=Enterobacter cloacae complex sp. ECC445 TaxID=2913213 RepID=UPI001F272F7A|nr:TniQ family protein [Enterobacter cloacae complex sp. ECC445]MCG0459267.1 TniQ family protein [Enterobacter cloacae complex sp. ECC445]